MTRLPRRVVHTGIRRTLEGGDRIAAGRGRRSPLTTGDALLAGPTGRLYRRKMLTMFTPILMTFGGDDGATREVAEEIAAILREEQLETEVRPLHTISGLDGYGTVMLGAAIVDGQWDPNARAFLLAHRTELIALPVAVFATAPPNAGPEDMVSDRSELLEELAHLRWLHPIAADLFRGTGRQVRTTVGASHNGHGSPNGKAPGFDLDAVRTWARWVARVLQPAMR